MVEKGTDPLARRAKVDILLERTAFDLKEMLREAARELDPFPFFLSSG